MRPTEIAEKRLQWAKKLQLEIRELKALIYAMHGDGELSDKDQDLANDIVNEMLEEEE
tara:strand:- start:699 stop:872 length:174 start_codon:yes stop_codon:yes gene_type:complete